MIIFILILLLVLLIIFILKYKLPIRRILWKFKHCNVIVFGKKGTGKDLLFQYVINKRHDNYYSNISYGGKYKKVTLKQVSCEPNTYNALINNKVVKTPHLFKDKKDFYISDCGNFLPSYMDSTLYKHFPSMPLFYSLSRHLYACNVHVNTQALERVWKSLREQADYYICVKRSYNLGLFILTKCICYDRYKSALEEVNPIKPRLFNKYSRAEVDLYKAQHGEIRTAYFINFKYKIKYNTRAFEKILLKGKRKH